MRRIALLLSVMALMLTVGASVALAANVKGNNRANTIMGTANNDVLSGLGATTGYSARTTATGSTAVAATTTSTAATTETSSPATPAGT